MVERAIRFVEHGDVFRILPARAAFASSVEEAQESERVHVIGAPCSAHESFEVEFGLSLKKSLPLHVTQADRDAEILFPLSLHPLGEGSVLGLRVIDKLDLVHRKLWTGETAVRVLGHGITGLAEQLSRFRSVEGLRFGLRVSRKHSFRREPIQRFYDATPISVGNLIDREIKRLSNLWII